MLQNSIAAVFAHPDDEVLACGGALARHAAAGCQVHILLLSSGQTSRGDVGAEPISSFEETARKAGDAIGASSVSFAGFPDNAIDTVPRLEVVKRIEAFFDEHNPDTVYTHHAGDRNIDHRIACDAVLTAARPLPGSGIRTVLAGEVLSSSDYAGPDAAPFRATWFVDVSGHLDAKMAALSVYETEMRDFPHPRSYEAVRHLAALRGAQAGFTAAEAFQLLRHGIPANNG